MIELRPRFADNLLQDNYNELIRNDVFYVWICKMVKVDDSGYVLINENCGLTAEELLVFHPEESKEPLSQDSKNPDIYLFLAQLDDADMGAIPYMLATKRECDYFALNITEL